MRVMVETDCWVDSLTMDPQFWVYLKIKCLLFSHHAILYMLRKAASYTIYFQTNIHYNWLRWLCIYWLRYSFIFKKCNFKKNKKMNKIKKKVLELISGCWFWLNMPEGEVNLTQDDYFLSAIKSDLVYGISDELIIYQR